MHTLTLDSTTKRPKPSPIHNHRKKRPKAQHARTRSHTCKCADGRGRWRRARDRSKGEQIERGARRARNAGADLAEAEAFGFLRLHILNSFPRRHCSAFLLPGRGGAGKKRGGCRRERASSLPVTIALAHRRWRRKGETERGAGATTSGTRQDLAPGRPRDADSLLLYLLPYREITNRQPAYALLLRAQNFIGCVRV